MRGCITTARATPLAVALILVTVTACEHTPVEAPPSAANSRVSLQNGDAIPGRFIVTVAEGVAPASVAGAHGVAPDFVYHAALNGFAGAMSNAAREGLLRDARVVRVEPDRAVHAFGTQTNATWGLDRTDQRALPLNGTYTWSTSGASVNAYIIDTGIRTDHVDFGIRARSGFDAVDGGSADDCNGHGTHVAGTVGGTTWGVAKDVALIAVRVLDCQGSGTISGVIAGVDWVTANHVKPAVANMSLGGGASSSLDDAVRNSIAAGVSYAVAAGNGDFIGRAQDACNYSPARVAEAMTIGATNDTDTKASWSNYGNCVDWFAPGVSITSAWHTSSTATNTISGTSMATPHTAGVAALYLESNPAATPAAVRTAIYDATTKGIVSSSNTANNHLLYNVFGSSGGTEEPPPATAVSLAVSGYKVKGVIHADLTWSGATSTSIDVYRNGARITTTANDGAYTDNTGLRGGGSLTYRVCEAGTSTCSNDVTVQF